MDVTKLFDKELKQLRVNASSRHGPEAERILQAANTEIKRRNGLRPARSRSLLSWRQEGDRYDAYLGDRIVASIKKVANHSLTQRDVYQATVGDDFYKRFEYIEVAKKEISQEIRTRGLDASASTDIPVDPE
ncbi:hypothetical protein [Microvirga yunnanensis]|uniref:hypothetical protein n=1 Tax=Microvirga yunnanensis TaxID=2953740 RepID=UPI0021C895A9|nr:hypothetical protein [Microvirga sp. HBU65207]